MRLKKMKIAKVACATALTVAAVYTVFAQPETEVVEYRTTISQGETLWDVCSRIASNEDDLSYLVWQTKKENGIQDAGNLQSGTEIVVHPRKVVRP